jgi:hypothetical protein
MGRYHEKLFQNASVTEYRGEGVLEPSDGNRRVGLKYENFGPWRLSDGQEA